MDDRTEIQDGDPRDIYDFSRVICRKCGSRIDTSGLTPGENFMCPACRTVNTVGQNLKDEIVRNRRETEVTITGGGSAYAAESNADGSPPKIIGKCRISRFLGAGSMGEVYMAHHMTLDIPVALKVLLPKYTGLSDFAERFIREARTAAKMNHQNVVRVYDCGSEKGTLYIIMEYVDGGTVADMLRIGGGPLKPDIALKIGTAVAAALVEAEKFGIIHRDIKPSNIMRTADGIFKLADLGLAKQIIGHEGKDQSLTMTAVSMGTPLYMPPEQALDAKNCDIRADIYALGITLYQLLSGRPPFESEDRLDLLRLHAGEIAEPLKRINPDLPDGLCAVVHKCMEKERRNRYQSPKDLLEHLQALAGGRPLSIETASGRNGPSMKMPASEVGSSGTMKRSLAAAAGIVLAAAIFLGFEIMMGKGRSAAKEPPSGSKLPMAQLENRDEPPEKPASEESAPIKAAPPEKHHLSAPATEKIHDKEDSRRQIPAYDEPDASDGLDLGFESPTSSGEGPPRGWRISPSKEYSVSVDRTISHSGGASCRISSSPGAEIGKDLFCSIVKPIKRSVVSGRTMMFSAYVRTQSVEGKAGIAILSESLAPESAVAIPFSFLSGTNDWKKKTCELRVSEDISDVKLELKLIGSGTMWADDLRLEILDHPPQMSTAKPSVEYPPPPARPFVEYPPPP